MLQGALATRLADGWAVVLVAVWFMLIHFRPVEYPGLLLFGLILGWLRWKSRRLGMPILAHAAFNVTGLVLAW